MDDTPTYWHSALRWIVLPIVPVITYLFVKLTIEYALSQSWGIKIDEVTDGRLKIESARDLVVVFSAFVIESIATGSSIYSASFVAPAKKRTVFVSLASIFAVLILVLTYISGVYSSTTNISILSTITSLLGLSVGVIGAGFYVWNEYSDNDDDGLSLGERFLYIFSGLVVVTLAVVLFVRSLLTQSQGLIDSNSDGNADSQTDSECIIKGNISVSGERIYHLPSDMYYTRTDIDASKGERWFCDENQAIEAGWRHSKV